MLEQKKQFMGKYIKYLIYLIITLIVLILLGGLMLENAHRINNAAIAVREHYIGFMIWRYFIMAMFIAFYPKFIRWFFSKNKNITERQIVKFSKRRYAVLLCFFYELMIVQNGLSLLINGLLSL